jgi:multidrug efflux pump subunit AcrB
MGNFFVNRPIVAMVIAIFTVIVGTVFLGGLPIEQYPNITPPIVEVRTTYTGANAISVEQSVATPLEQEINGVENMIYMKSTNSNDGTMVVQVSFEVGTDPDMNTVFTQNRVAGCRNSQASRRSKKTWGHDPEIPSEHSHAHHPDIRRGKIRSAISRQLCADQY